MELGVNEKGVVDLVSEGSNVFAIMFCSTNQVVDYGARLLGVSSSTVNVLREWQGFVRGA